MDIYCTRPGCPRPINACADLENRELLKTVSQKFCISCGMPLILGGRYLPMRLLGKGGFGAAFLARDRYTPTMRQCVVKQFQPSGSLNARQLATAQDLFEREAMVLEELGSQHPQIPDLFAFFPLSAPSRQQPGQHEQFFYIVQEFIDGETLEQELLNKSTFSEPEVLEVLQAILPVLQFIHEHDSIHRDIKPSNIMRDRRGRLYLLDFGAVKQVTKGSNLGGTSTGIYSMGFAPPEQMAGSQVYPATDLYALAVTCLTLLTGKEPKDLFDAYNNQWDWQHHAQVSPLLTGVLDKMLQASPHQRFASAQQVLDVLEKPQPAPLPPPPPAPLPPPPPAPLPPPPPPVRATRRMFPLPTLLAMAVFTGVEGALIAVILFSLPLSPGLTIGALGAIVAGLGYGQYKQWIERTEQLIVLGLTLAVLLWVPGLRGGWALGDLMILAVTTGAAGALSVSLFLLLYRGLTRILR